MRLRSLRTAGEFAQGAQRGVRIAMNNSFGFGGNNCSLVFGAERGS